MVNDNQITVSTGVIFKTKEVPLALFDILRKQFKKTKPTVPVIKLKDDNRTEENPNDPDYIKATAEWEADFGAKQIDICIMLGTSIVSIPDGVYKPEDKEWAEQFKVLDMDIKLSDDPKERYLTWVKLYAAPNQEDLQKIMLGASRAFGVTEADVAEATEMFRNIKERRTNPKSSIKA